MSESQQEPSIGFAGFKLGTALRRGIDAAGFQEPRPIQERTIPAAIDGRDILGLAQTGTGKTAAFALPVLEQILDSRGKYKGPRALVVAPTRELANQISEEIRLLARYTDINVATLFGGVSAAKQLASLRQRPEIIVACPGRLLDLWRQGKVHLDQVATLVLDEADHMFDMGFLPDIRRIIGALPDRRQNLLFSATMPKEIRRLADRILRDPHVVELNHTQPIETIEHALFPIDGTRKFELLEFVLEEKGFTSAIVFTRTKHRAKKLARQLEGLGHNAVALQGNMSQNARERAMDGFRKRTFNILVATDIAARGIDVEAVSHVVNFDMPTTPEAYTHRIGRTGRSERQGRAYTFVTPEDRDLVRAVERRLGGTIPRKGFDGPIRPAQRRETRPQQRPTSQRQAAARPPQQRRRRRRSGGGDGGGGGGGRRKPAA
ncbi:MAG: DEAD/DEAH box helicase [Acidobacteriota bacterium]|nr:DEAD/DEAH box helicase [Acidobacteriota bacterium]